MARFRLNVRKLAWFDLKFNRDWQRVTPTLLALEDRFTPTATFAAYQVPTDFFFDTGLGALSAPSEASIEDIARDYLRVSARDFGLSVSDIAGAKVTSSYTDADTGIGHVYLRQMVNGLEVNGADFTVGINAAGQVITAGGGFVPGLTEILSLTPQPDLSPSDAVNHAIATLTSFDTDPIAPGCQCELCGRQTSFALPKLTTPAQTFMASNSIDRQAWVGSSFSNEPITAKLEYVPTPDGRAVLAWNLNIQTLDYASWFDLAVDATTGELRHLADWTDDAGYQTVPMPNEHPNDGGFAVLADPQLANASPFGWHDTNGVAGPEFTDTRGNNVLAALDRDANNTPDTTPPRPDGGSALNFSTYSYDVTLAPNATVANQQAAVTNLFYVNNWLHDVHYQYGFTPAAGNFQTNTYGGGGAGNDAVNADAQDGSGTNNANFSTPVDGTAPRMQMYIWTQATPDRDSDMDNGIIHHEYGHGVSNRLTGGPGNSSALNNIQSGGMGEGWSDFYTLMFGQRATHTSATSRPVGNYSNNSTNGIRAYPYSFDMGVSPIMWDSFGTSGTTSYGLTRSTAVHRTGTVWAATLWDMNWLLIGKHGYDSDLSTGWSATPGPASAGNKLALRLVMDGMKLQPANPSFTQARDAILAADTALTGGANHLQIWQAFARRGLGEGASVGASTSTTTLVNNTTIPTNVQTLQVTTHTPSDHASVTTPPTSFVLNFNDPLDAGSIAAADFTVNGIPATAVNYTAGSTTATFTFATSPVTVQGLQTMALVAGAVARASDAGPVQDFAASFRYDATALTVTSLMPTAGSNQPPPLTSIDFNLSEAIDPASVSTFDLVMNAGYATAVTLLNSNQTVRFTVTGLIEEQAQTVSMVAGALKDVFGNPSTAYTATFQLDYSTRAFATPLTAVAPLGSAVYEGSMTGLVNTNADTDDFTITLDAGQVLNVVVDPASGLQPRLRVLSPTNATLADVTATGTGIDAVATVTVATAGTYTLRLSSNGSTNGRFTLTPTLNTLRETETIFGTTNNTAATAQSLAPGLLTTTTSAASITRTTMLGTTDIGTVYTATPVAYAFEDISATGATLLTNSDDVSTFFNIPFNFNFYGTEYSTVHVSDNGLITFGSGSASNANGSLASSPSQATIAAFWDDLVTGPSGIKWQVLGTAGSRRVVVQWELAKYYVTGGTSNNTLQFQAILYEGTNQVRLNYAQLTGGVAGRDEGVSASIGVKNATSTSTLLLSQNSATSIYHGTGKSTLISPPGTTGDYYSFVATAGQTASVAVRGLSAGTVDVDLLATDGTTVLASGTAEATNLTSAIANFAIPASGAYYVMVSGGGTSLPYSVSVVTGAVDAEANNTAATATPLGTSRAALGQLDAGNDDWFSVTLPAGTNALQLATTTPGDAPGEFVNTLNPSLQLYSDAAGTTLLGNGTTQTDGRNESLTVTGLTAGNTYYIRLSPTGGTSGEYALGALPFSAAPTVEAVSINIGASQRSRVLSVSVDFDTAVTIAPNAITLSNGVNTLTNAPNGGILFNASIVSGETLAVLTFDPAVAGVDVASLNNGIWTLTITAAGVTNTATGTPMVADSTTTINRLKGDYDANGTVNGADLVTLGNFFNSNDVAFDFDGNGIIDGTDLTIFGNSFGASL